MRRSLITALALPAALAALAIAPSTARADGGTSVGTPVPRADSFTIAPPTCVTAYRLASVTITDNGVLLNGKAAPACLRIWNAGTFKLQNATAGEVTVTLDGDTNPMVPGELWNYQPIGGWYGAGSEFTLEVAEFPGFELEIQVF